MSYLHHVSNGNIAVFQWALNMWQFKRKVASHLNLKASPGDPGHAEYLRQTGETAENQGPASV